MPLAKNTENFHKQHQLLFTADKDGVICATGNELLQIIYIRERRISERINAARALSPTSQDDRFQCCKTLCFLPPHLLSKNYEYIISAMELISSLCISFGKITIAMNRSTS